MYIIAKGTHDVIQDEALRYQYIETLLSKIAETYGYNEFRTPIIEYSDLFLRSTGESSDIVRKEMYTFEDKGGRSITLRPEITAGIIRSFVNNKLFANQDFPVKAYYVGPCFRYERPQQGRYRQFNQFGIECIGASSVYRDIEAIMLGYNSLLMLGFKNVKLKINNLGDDLTRESYQKALKEYYSKHIDKMCDDCKERFNINVLRMLDCKVESDIEINKNAPRISDFYSEEAKNKFKVITDYLTKNEIPFEIDTNLVRGLDYYTGVVFEYHYTSVDGKNLGALGGGGHYAKLVKELGGPDLESVGFAFGIERLAALMEADNLFTNIESSVDVYVMPIGESNYEYCFDISNYLRSNGYSSDVCLESKGLGQMFKKAERRKSKFAIIVGDDEKNNNTVNLKNLENQEQKNIKVEDLISTLDELFEVHHHEHE